MTTTAATCSSQTLRETRRRHRLRHRQRAQPAARRGRRPRPALRARPARGHRRQRRRRLRPGHRRPRLRPHQHRHRSGQRGRLADRVAQRRHAPCCTSPARSRAQYLGSRTRLHPRDQGPARHAHARSSTHAATVPDADSAGTSCARPRPPRSPRPAAPSSVEWPIDLQYAAQHRRPPSPCEAAAAARPDPAVSPPPAALLAAARRPLIWAGGGVATRRRRTDRTARRAGAPDCSPPTPAAAPSPRTTTASSATTPPPPRRAPCSPTPTCCSPSAPTSAPTRPPTTASNSPPRTSRSTSTRPRSAGCTPPPSPCTATPPPSSPHCLRTPSPAEGGWTRPWPARVRRPAPTSAARSAHGHRRPQAAICDAIRAALPARVRRRPRRHHPLQHLGQPAAGDVRPASQRLPPRRRHRTGPRHGHRRRTRPRPDAPTVVIAGDGGLAVHLGELLTLAQEKPRLMLLVFNDGGYGVLRNMQDAPRRAPLRRRPRHPRLRTARRGRSALPYLRIAAEQPTPARPRRGRRLATARRSSRSTSPPRPDERPRSPRPYVPGRRRDAPQAVISGSTHSRQRSAPPNPVIASTLPEHWQGGNPGHERDPLHLVVHRMTWEAEGVTVRRADPPRRRPPAGLDARRPPRRPHRRATSASTRLCGDPARQDRLPHRGARTNPPRRGGSRHVHDTAAPRPAVSGPANRATTSSCWTPPTLPVRRRRHRHHPDPRDDRRGRPPGRRVANCVYGGRSPRVDGLPRRTRRTTATACTSSRRTSEGHIDLAGLLGDCPRGHARLLLRPRAPARGRRGTPLLAGRTPFGSSGSPRRAPPTNRAGDTPSSTSSAHAPDRTVAGRRRHLHPRRARERRHRRRQLLPRRHLRHLRDPRARGHPRPPRLPALRARNRSPAPP